MGLSIDKGDAFVLPSRIGVDDGAAFRDLVGMWVDDGTAWRLIFPNDQLALLDGPTVLVTLPEIVIVSYDLLANGNNVSGGATQPWITPTSHAPNFEVRATLLNGNVTGPFNAWLPLTADRSWGYSGPSSGGGDVRFELGRAGSNSAILTKIVSIIGIVETGG